MGLECRIILVCLESVSRPWISENLSKIIMLELKVRSHHLLAI